MTELLRQKLAQSFPIPASRYFVIDSFPLPVCKFGRARYCRSFRADGANYGRCPSKKETYFGFKVHALITLDGYITAFEVTHASVDDREGLRDLAENRLGLVILGDKGYTGEALFDDMRFLRIPAALMPMPCAKPMGSVSFPLWKWGSMAGGLT